MNNYNKKKSLTHPFQRLALPGDVLLKTEDPFYFTSSLHLLPVLPFDFNSSLLLSDSIKRTWHPDPGQDTFRHYSAIFLVSQLSQLSHIPCLNTLSLRFIGLSCGNQSELGLCNIISSRGQGLKGEFKVFS